MIKWIISDRKITLLNVGLHIEIHFHIQSTEPNSLLFKKNYIHTYIILYTYFYTKSKYKKYTDIAIYVSINIALSRAKGKKTTYSVLPVFFLYFFICWYILH